MSYVTKYRVIFDNEHNQRVEVLFKELNGTTADEDVQEYAAIDVRLSYAGDEGKYAPIIGSTLDVEFDVLPDDLDYWNDFASGVKFKWKVEAYIDSVAFFIGFLVPDEGGVPLLDKPYNAKVSATDGIGLLRDIALVQPDGTNLVDHNKFIWYVACALQQTGLALPIRVYDNFFHRSMSNRDDDPKNDFASQAYLEARTFLKDATTFVDCYRALEILLTEQFRLFQWRGEWVIIRLGMLQYTPFVGYYTLYDYNGLNPVGYEITEDYGKVGKNEIVYPHGEDQMKYIKKASKSATTTHQYDPWPELPKNNKFERGTQFATGTDATDNTLTYKKISIDDWVYGRTPSFNDFENLVTTSNKAYRYSTYDQYNIEKDRIIQLEKASGDVQHFLRSEGIPVRKGYKISISVDNKRSFSGSGSFTGFYVVIRKTGASDLSWMDNLGNWRGTGIGGVEYFYQSGEDVANWHTYDINSIPVPYDGTLYVMFTNNGDGFNIAYYQNFSIEVKPFIAGGYLQVTGESQTFTQTAQDFPDKSEAEVFLSDSGHKILKGCLLDSSGVPLTPDWHRMGMLESKSYLALINFNKFQLEQRRYWMVEGSFTGLFFEYNNNVNHPYPLSLAVIYRFTDLSDFDRRFILCAPLDMNLGAAEFTGRFYEVFIDNKIFFDGQRGGNATHKYLFE